MASELDLSLLPLCRVNGVEQPTLPGLAALTPPRRPARGRERDRLLVYLSLSGNTPLTSAELSQLVAQVGSTFYQTSGSLTFALKTSAELANTTLVERNMRTTGHGQYVMGVLVLAALRDNQFYFVQSGPTHVYHLGQDATQHFYDAQLAGRGLGFSQTARLYFSHMELAPGDRLAFSAQMPPLWEVVLPGERQSASLETTRRRLMAEQDVNISAVLVGVTEGPGQVTVLRPELGVSSTPAPAPAKMASVAALSESEPGPAPLDELPEEASVTSSAPGPAQNPAPRPVRPLSTTSADGTPVSTLPRHAPSRRVVSPPTSSQGAGKNFFRALAKSVTSMRIFGRKASAGAQTMATRVMPGDGEQPVAISPTWFKVLVIAVPLMIIVMAFVVYNQFGRSSEYQKNFTSAEQAAAQAVAETDPVLQRSAWESTLYYLQEAEKYMVTEQSQALRQQAQTSLDTIEKIVRVEYRPAFPDGLTNIQVTQMAASDSDVYMLNVNTGGIMRAIRTAKGYALDETFNASCVPGNYGGIQVGSLIDIVGLDENVYNATVMGVDATGHGLYCEPDAAPRVFGLASPDTGWGNIVAITFDANTLYVLDPSHRAVWIYDGIKGEFPERPRYFFGEQFPQTSIETSIDLAVSGNDLYLLNKDGHLTTCVYSPLTVSDTRCTDYTPYVDTRPGRESGPKLADATFSHIQFTPPPNSTVAFLDPATQAIYRFAPRSLQLQDLLRAAPGENNPLPEGEPATAMSLSQNRTLYLFVAGQLYYAENVP